MEKILETLKSLAPVLALIGGWMAKAIKDGIKWLAKNQVEIASIVKRVEADSKDGWTAEEKKNYAWELFKKYLYPKLPWYIQIMPDSFIKAKFFSIIDKIIAKAKEMKQPK